MYLVIYTQAIGRHSLSFFFMMAEFGSFWLYADFFLEHKKWRIYAVMGLLSLLIFLIFSPFIQIDSLFYSVLILFFWTLGGLRFVLHLCISKNRAYLGNYFCLYLSLPLFVIISDYFLALSGQQHPLVQDEFLMAIDGSLGIYPSLLIGRVIRALPQGLNDILNLFYLALPLAFALVYTRLQSLKKNLPYDLIVEIILTGVLGYALYGIIPGCGSVFAFHDTWPDSLPMRFLQEGPQWIHCPINLPRNCLPSLHMAWVVCLLRHAWFDPITRKMIWVLAIGTLIAMFGIGAHYLIDIIVGFAFANVIGGLCASQLSWKNTARWQALFFGGLLCIGWYVLILYGIDFLHLSKIVAWCIFLSSILLGLHLERKLFLARERASNAI